MLSPARPTPLSFSVISSAISEPTISLSCSCCLICIAACSPFIFSMVNLCRSLSCFIVLLPPTIFSSAIFADLSCDEDTDSNAFAATSADLPSFSISVAAFSEPLLNKDIIPSPFSSSTLKDFKIS